MFGWVFKANVIKKSPVCFQTGLFMFNKDEFFWFPAIPDEQNLHAALPAGEKKPVE